MDAARIGGVNIVRLITEDAAIALSYGIFRKKDLSATAKNTLFIDLGTSKLSMFVAAFTNEKF